jgi:HEXXH motif-containing protein
MDDLAERIKASLRIPNGEPWFPELTADLATRAWDSLHRDIGLTLDSYGTERVLSRSISAPRKIITSLRTSPSPGAPTIAIEALSEEYARQYHKAGVTFYSPDEIANTTVLSCIEDALAIINQVPSLMRTVATLVRSLLVIKPKDADYDVSLSEPHVPFSIFVSVPQERIANDALRVAEAIVHEAMHLQLTLIEQTVRLALRTSQRIFSPWRDEYRTVQGVLHALYIFRVVDQFLGRVSTSRNNPSKLVYIQGRRNEIAQQMVEIRSFEQCSDLTETGARLAKNLIHFWSDSHEPAFAATLPTAL